MTENVFSRTSEPPQFFPPRSGTARTHRMRTFIDGYDDAPGQSHSAFGCFLHPPAWRSFAHPFPELHCYIHVDGLGLRKNLSGEIYCLSLELGSNRSNTKLTRVPLIELVLF